MTYTKRNGDGLVTIRAMSPKRKGEYLDALMARFGAACAYCGRTVHRAADGPDEHDLVAVAEHVVPVARGGEDDAENIVLACVRCNSSKGNQLLLEWAFVRAGVIRRYGRSREPRFVVAGVEAA